MPEPRPREDESQRPNEMPEVRPNERPEPERDDPTGLPSNDIESKPTGNRVLDVDEDQLIDPAAEPGKPV